MKHEIQWALFASLLAVSGMNLGVNAFYARACGKSVISKIYLSEPDVQLAYVETHLRF